MLSPDMAIEDRLTREQLAEFERLADANDDQAAAAWLRHAVANYDQVIADQTTALKQNISQLTIKLCYT
jgi:hypothetical protein